VTVPTRADFLALARGFVGLSYDGDPERFMGLIAPGEDVAAAEAMAGESTCGLFVRGLLNAMGCTDARVVAPYRTGKVMSDILAMAHEAGAVKPLAGAEPGDIVMIEGPEHVFIVESIDGPLWATIQGGERDAARAQQIQWITRTLMGGLLGGRRVSLVADFDKLAERFL
jgi:hypothetical protein